MARGVPVDIDKREKIIKWFPKGLKVFKIAEKINLKWHTVKSIIKHFERRGTVTAAPKSGRPRCTGPRMDRQIINTALKSRRMTLDDLGRTIRDATGARISNKTVQRRLHDAKLYGHAARKKPLLSDKHKKARLAWCRNHQN